MPKKRSTPKVFRILNGHKRLILCAALCAVTFIALTGYGHWPTRFLIAWDFSTLVYLALAYATFRDFDIKRVRLRAAEQDEGALFLLIMTILAAIVSLAAILAVLQGAKNANNAHWAFFVFAVVTVMLSWALIHTIFAFHYAHEFYGTGRDDRCGGLQFPEDDRPDYWDFVYFSFVVGMTFQVSDVQVTSKRIRHLVVIHGIVSFIFSVSILSLAVNIASNFI